MKRGKYKERKKKRLAVPIASSMWAETKFARELREKLENRKIRRFQSGKAFSIE